jgi:hypothetical protein
VRKIIFDIEGNGLKPTKIWCMAWKEIGKEEYNSTTSYDEMRNVLEQADTLIGHNIIRFDIPILKRLLKIDIKANLVDTLGLSWYLYPNMQRHGLETWGEIFGIKKPKIDNWDNLSIEEYLHRCVEDVKNNTMLWNKQEAYLTALYGTEEKYSKLIGYLSFKLDCAREQEESGWRMDLEKAKALSKLLEQESANKLPHLIAAMPKVEKTVDRSRPEKPYKKNGTLSVQGAKWFSKLRERGLPDDYRGVLKEVVSVEEPNPDSSQQIKDWLSSLGWVPKTFKYAPIPNRREKRAIPQIRKDDNGEKVLCPSVIALIDKEPAIEHLNGLTVINHRKSIVDGWLRDVDEKGYLKAEVAGLTNTLRFKHTTIVNVPGVMKPYGKEIRSILIAPEGYELCGSDQSSLEDRTKQHYMWEHDSEYVKEMQKPDFDPHLDLAYNAGAITNEQVLKYKSGEDTSIKPIRHKYKTANYACVYGAGPPRLRVELEGSLAEAKELWEAYWKRNWSVKKIAEACRTKTVDGQMWLYNPVAKLWYSLRNDKDRFSTLNQGTGTYCFDRWVFYIRRERPQLTAQFHDEVILCVKIGYREKCKDLLNRAVVETNKTLKLNRELGVDIQFGSNYAEIH